MLEFVEKFQDQKTWDSFIAKNSGPDGGLLQSWVWGEVQREYRRPVWRIALRDGERVVTAWQVISHRLPLGWSYWYVPRPVSCQLLVVSYRNFFDQVIALARKEKILFIRVDGGDHAMLEKLGFQKVSGAVQPQEELIVDVQRPEEELLAAMKPKTRYNIRLAEKHGVEVLVLPPDEHSFKKFWPLVCDTAARQKIRLHPQSYYWAMFSVFGRSKTGNVLLAAHKGNPLAAAFVVTYNGVLTYLHGGHAHESSELMAPYLLHWQAMKLAQQHGGHTYNFGGVSTTKADWAGISRFKRGFAPREPFTTYEGLCERPLKPLSYGVYRIVRR